MKLRQCDMKFQSKLLIIPILVFVLTPFLILGQTDCPPNELCNPLKAKTFEELVNNIIKFIYNLALWIAPVMFIISGFYYITAAGDPAKIETAKKIAIYTAIGLVVVVSAQGLIALFKTIFTSQQPGVGR